MNSTENRRKHKKYWSKSRTESFEPNLVQSKQKRKIWRRREKGTTKAKLNGNMNIPKKIQNQNKKLRDKMGRKEANSLKHRFQEPTGAIIPSLISNSSNFLKSISTKRNSRNGFSFKIECQMIDNVECSAMINFQMLQLISSFKRTSRR